MKVKIDIKTFWHIYICGSGFTCSIVHSNLFPGVFRSLIAANDQLSFDMNVCHLLSFLQRENGMICDKANYTVLNTTTAGANGQTHGATIGVTNSGRTVATFLVTRAVSDIARISRSICR